MNVAIVEMLPMPMTSSNDGGCKLGYRFGTRLRGGYADSLISDICMVIQFDDGLVTSWKT